MRLAPLLLVFAAATLARADDDPDLAVVSGRVAKNAPGEVRLRLVRRVAYGGGWYEREDTLHDVPVHPGDAFRLAGLQPGRYVLIAEGDRSEKLERTLDVFADVVDVELRPVRAAQAPRLPEATFSGTLTLGFDGELNRCDVSIAGRRVTRYPDGALRCVDLRPGATWITVDYRDDDPLKGWLEHARLRRRFPLTLVAGENHADIRVEPHEDVRLVLHPQPAGGRIDGFLAYLDPSPEPDDRGEQIAFDTTPDGTPRAYRWRSMYPDSLRFKSVGPDLPLTGLTRGKHRIRIAAEGYKTVEHAFDVSGATRVEVGMKPLPGTYVRPVVDGSYWFVEERATDGSWAPLFTWGHRLRFGGLQDPPPARHFLAPGVHVLRAAKQGVPPSAPVEFRAGDDRSARQVEFTFTEGRTLLASFATPAGTDLRGFDAFLFVQDGDRWQRLRAQDVVVAPLFRIEGLAPGNYRLAFDEEGRHVIGEFEMKDADAERVFLWRTR